ncbi:hypothetical protein N658DRAFT_406626, partial [Parathielavia hyrcaniae]
MESHAYRTRIHRFSSKPPGHEAARQRENQRRHRARVKGRIADLEAALSDTQSKLNEALRQIDLLAAEVSRLHVHNLRPAEEAQTLPTVPTPSTPPPEKVPGSATSVQHNAAEPDASGPTDGLVVPSSPCCTTTPDQSTATAALDHVQLGSTKITTELHTSIEPVADLEESSSDCSLLPASGAGESTIPCRDAYLIIKERSSPEFDLSAANEWLKPGFRRAVVPGTGCRVQTHILFAFVDYMT